MKSFNKLTISILVSSLALFGCHKDKKNDTTTGTSTDYSVPSKYSSYSDADYSDVTTTLHMFKYLENQLKLGVPASGTHALDASLLKQMYANTGSPFTDSTQWNNLNISLNEQTALVGRSIMNGYIDTYAAASASTQTASDGGGTPVAGLLATSANKNVLFATDGINYAQVIQKVGFSVLFINQIHTILRDIHTLDNSSKVAGKNYTAQEHAWDRAFGYSGFPGNYTADSLASSTFWGVATNRAKYFYVANYSIQVDGGIHTTKTLVNAFLKGRAAISHKDYTTRDQQIAIIDAALEKFLGGCVLHEIGEITASSNAKFLDPASRNSSMSEIIGFVLAIEYAPNRTTMSDDDIQDILNHLHYTNVWDISLTDIAYVKNKISTIYGLVGVKDTI